MILRTGFEDRSDTKARARPNEKENEVHHAHARARELSPDAFPFRALPGVPGLEISDGSRFLERIGSVGCLRWLENEWNEGHHVPGRVLERCSVHLRIREDVARR